MIVGISGKINSGKDEIAQIWQWLSQAREAELDEKMPCRDYWINLPYEYFKEQKAYKISPFKHKKFATNVARVFFEILGIDYHKVSREEKGKLRPTFRDFANKTKEVLGEDVWVKSLMKDYIIDVDYPDWVISDVRFLNEAKAIKEREGIVIRVNRPKVIETVGLIIMDMSTDDRSKDVHIKSKEHESETALDDYEDFDYVINNDGTIEDLIKQVKLIYNDIKKK